MPFPAKSDGRSRVAGNGTEGEVKTIELSSPTSGDEQWAFLNLHDFTAVEKTVPILRKLILLSHDINNIKCNSECLKKHWLN